ncbi:MAG: polysaccharide biosynthesis/export family protein [Bacteroidales bacterium]|jgi:polysaccharide export outer membrane protein|nr:polysaccharide biosynthesis/export family protein [Bacteroidales bacterium]
MREKNKTIIILIIMLAYAGCVPKKNLTYFNDIEELTEPIANPRLQKVIMPFDKLYIKVVSIDPLANQMFNSEDEIRGGGEGATGLLGYPVDENGNINFPFVGRINVLSLTTSQAAEKIQESLSAYVPNTSVTVKFVDNQITVIGEVQRQGVFQFSQDKLNIYEAIGLGGGITRYGDRKNIILIRNESGKIIHYRLNLSDSKIAQKDTYYILPNDVVVVEPLDAISSSYANITYTTILTSITTLIAILLFIGF